MSSDDFLKTDVLYESCKRGAVRLLKASELAKLLVRGHSREFRRQDFEKHNPEMFATEDLLQRCFWEVEAAAKYPGCAYPGIVSISYCWKTRMHPDPSGELGRKIATYLHWYAAQRAMWTRERLCKYSDAAGHTWSTEYDFDWEFSVLVDFWALYQNPRSEEERKSFSSAQNVMHQWYGHRGTMVFMVTEVPDEWTEDATFDDRGGYVNRGWPVFECAVANLCKPRGMCLDMAGFGEMLDCAQVWGKEQAGMENFGWRAGQLTGMFCGALLDNLRQLAMDDYGGLVTERSCLFWLVDATQQPPRSPASMEALLHGKSFADSGDLALCAAMYGQALALTFGTQKALDYSHMTHWSEADFGALAGALATSEKATQLNLLGCEMRDRGVTALAAGLSGGSLPLLEKLNLKDNGVGRPGLEALAAALQRGAMPVLRTIVMGESGVVDGEVLAMMSEAAAGRARWDGQALCLRRRGGRTGQGDSTDRCTRCAAM